MSGEYETTEVEIPVPSEEDFDRRVERSECASREEFVARALRQVIAHVENMPETDDTVAVEAPESYVETVQSLLRENDVSPDPDEVSVGEQLGAAIARLESAEAFS